MPDKIGKFSSSLIDSWSIHGYGYDDHVYNICPLINLLLSHISLRKPSHVHAVFRDAYVKPFFLFFVNSTSEILITSMFNPRKWIMIYHSQERNPVTLCRKPPYSVGQGSHTTLFLPVGYNKICWRTLGKVLVFLIKVNILLTLFSAFECTMRSNIQDGSHLVAMRQILEKEKQTTGRR
jgi:hypothetical protein